MTGNNPQVFFAAERTLLAWVRTGLGLLGMGFVVARFGLFLRLVRPDADPGRHLMSAALGVGLALAGAVVAAVAAWQHRRFCRTLGPDELPPAYRTGFGPAVALAVAAAGVVLALELVL